MSYWQKWLSHKAVEFFIEKQQFMQEFIQYLEELVDFERNCSVKFRGDNGGMAVIQTRLREIRIDEREGYIKTADGLRINLNQLIEVNGRSAQNIC
jgi:hypothetical protein